MGVDIDKQLTELADVCSIVSHTQSAMQEISKITAIEATLQVSANGHGTKEWRNLKQRARRNGYSLPKQLLVDTIKQQIKDKGILKRNYDDVLVVEISNCGGSASYKTWDDIPDHDVPCPCGDPTHWLIKYERVK